MTARDYTTGWYNPDVQPNPYTNRDIDRLLSERRGETDTQPLTERQNLATEVLALFPWLEGELLHLYTAAYVEYGDANLAWAEVRQSDIYDEVFAGNRRDDGSVRWDESQYMSIIEGYRDEIRAVGVNPDVFAPYYGELIAFNKSPAEFGAQVDGIYQRVVLGGQQVLDAYAAMFNYNDITREGLIAGLIHDDIHNALLDQQITIAEIQGEGVTAGFDPGDLARQLEEIDFTRAQARDLFGDAAELVPELAVLARRHADPDDEFNLEDFVSAAAFNDPGQGRRMRRLIAQERASFAQSGALGVRTDREGRLAGLEVR
jgi:hypothetical protein